MAQNGNCTPTAYDERPSAGRPNCSGFESDVREETTLNGVTIRRQLRGELCGFGPARSGRAWKVPMDPVVG